MGEHVFISYSSQDEAYARSLAEHLEAEGIEVWRDKDDLPIATPSYSKAIQAAISQSAALIVIMTPAADESAWVGNEVEEARSKNKPIFPLLLEGEPLFALKLVQYEQVTATQMPSQKFTVGLHKAIALARQQSQAAAVPVPPDTADTDATADTDTTDNTDTDTTDNTDTTAATDTDTTTYATTTTDTGPETKTDEPGQPPPPPRWPWRTVVAAVGAVVGVVGIVILAFVLLGGDDDEQGGGNSTTVPSTTNGGTGTTVPAHLEAPVGRDPRSMGLGFDSLWVLLTQEHAVWRLDPDTLDVEEMIGIGQFPQSLAVTEDGVWVSNTGDGTVQRIDPADNSLDEPIPVDQQPFLMDASGDTLWIAHVGGQSVVGIDTASGEVVQRIAFEAPLTDVAERDGVLWVTSFGGDDRIWRVPLDNPVPTPLEISTAGADPQQVEAHDDYVFALFQGSGELARYLPDGTLDRVVSFPGGTTAISVQGDDVWVAADAGDGATSVVRRYDAATLELLDELTGNGRTFGISTEGTSAWLALNHGEDVPGAVSRDDRPS